MTPKLNPKGQINDQAFVRACRAFEAGDKESAFRMALDLLSEDLSDYHAAGCHLILADSDDCQVEHAEEAIKLYKGLYTSQDLKPNKKQQENKEWLIAFAEKALGEARDAEARKVPQTDEERWADFDAAAARLDDFEARMWAADEKDSATTVQHTNEGDNQPATRGQQGRQQPSWHQHDFPFRVPSSSAPKPPADDDDDEDMLSPPPSQQH